MLRSARPVWLGILLCICVLTSSRLARAEAGPADPDASAPPPVHSDHEGLLEGPAPGSSRDGQHEAAARRAFEDGRSALEQGNFQAALRLFERAYDLSGRAELLFNIGTVLDRLRRDEDAARYFERYLEVRPGAANSLAVQARLEVLRDRLRTQERANVPSPEEVANRQVVVPPLHAEAPPARQDSAEPLRKKWWLWTTLVIVAGGGAIAGVLLTRDQDSREEAPLLGSQGAVAVGLWNH
jgi:tetratricopeptide (TPR) repeat protein